MSDMLLSTLQPEVVESPSGRLSMVTSRQSPQEPCPCTPFQSCSDAIVRELSSLRAVVSEAVELLRYPLMVRTESGGLRPGSTLEAELFQRYFGTSAPSQERPTASGSTPSSGELDYDSEASYPLVSFRTIGSIDGAPEEDREGP